VSRAHTPSLLQMEVAECGAASLGIILAYYGRIEPLTELRVRCGVSRDGSNASSLVQAARSYGLETKGFSRDVADLKEMKPPFIVFWDFNHFLVVEGFSKDRVHLNDPAMGHRSVSLEEFDNSFTGVVITLEPGPDFEKGGSAPSLVRAITSRLVGFNRAMAFAVLAGFLLVVPGLVIPAITQIFIDEIVVGGRTDWMRPLLVALVVAGAALGLLKFLQVVCLRRLRLGVSARMSAMFFQHLLRLPAAFYAQRYAGEIASRSRLNNSVAAVLSGRLAQTAIDAVMMVFYAGLMFFYDVGLTLVGIAFSMINFAVLRRISRWRIEANARVLQEEGKVIGVSIAGLQSIESIKASGMEASFFHRWSGHQANAKNASHSIDLTNHYVGMLPMFLGGITTMLILSFGGLKVMDGSMTIGMLLAFQILMSRFQGPVNNLVDLGQTMQQMRGDLARLDDVLAHQPDPIDGEEALVDTAEFGAQQRVKLSGLLELKGITFGYNPSAEPLLEDFDLTLKPGARVALVGGSGSGKSTIAKLASGLYQPWSGEILFDGKPRSKLPPDLINNSLAMVDQDVLLFAGTVRDNLTLWDETLPDEALVQACQDAEILERVQALAGGLDAVLDEGGGNLSGGERQRLEIARSLVCNPSILVLDEATSALDTESEHLIVDRISLRGCSCLIVAHRLSTIRDCDEIIVLEQGKVVERGTHDELWRRRGAYARLLELDESMSGASA
jgi:NHLM bacteriocin system ABC transporter peptidase/ATP-binding protein